MSSSEISGDETSNGKLDGAETQFQYKFRSPDLPALFSASIDATLQQKFPGGRIVAVLPAPAASSYQYDLVFVEIDKPSPSAKLEEHIKLKFAELSDPPQRFLDAFATKQLNSCLLKSSDSQPALHVVISTGSGARLAEVVFSNLVKPLLSFMRLWEDLDYKIHVTTSSNSITELTKSIILPRANNGSQQSIILLSGDGGIVDMVNALIDESNLGINYVKPIVAVIPVGTGNALANSTGIFADSTLGLSTLVRGGSKPLPLFQVSLPSILNNATNTFSNERSVAYGAVVFSWCMHAALVADSDTPEYRKHGSARFQMAAKEALFPSDGSLPHSYRAIVSILQKNSDGTLLPWRRIERTEHAYLLATFMNQLEKGFLISPNSKPLDETLRLIHFGPMSGDEAMKIMGAAFQGGGHVNDPRVSYEEVEAIKIDFNGSEPQDRWRRVCVDGKIFTVGEEGTVEVSRWYGDVLHLVHLER